MPRAHFVVLDSQHSSRAPDGPMLTWLRQDLDSTAQEWIIAFWHHPPYSHGTHNSDSETELREMRENILPTRSRADLILKKAGNHTVEEVALRRV